MPIYRVQQSITTVDNVNANYATNTFHTLADDLTAAQLFVTNLQTFYNAVRPQFSNLVRQNGQNYKIYDMTDPTPRAPKIDSSFNFGAAPAGTPLPTEVALCVSFQGVKLSGVPQARRRGRVFLPFFNTTALGTDGRPVVGTLSAVQTAADALVTASKAATTWKWIVLSSIDPSGGSVVDNGWIDNEWDTQRRRGRLPVTRYVFA